MKNEYYAPKDFKKGRLIANRYRTIDIIILSACALFSFISIITFIMIFAGQLSVITMILAIFVLALPAMIAFFLVQSFNVYHNFLLYFYVIYIFFDRPRTYIWEGITYED